MKKILDKTGPVLVGLGLLGFGGIWLLVELYNSNISYIYQWNNKLA